MNKIYSPSEKYLPRWLAGALQEASQTYGVVALCGARQTGKTTLLLNTEPFVHWRFHTLDDFDTLRQARQQPEALWAGTDRVVIDEVQRAPALLAAIKQALDRQPGRYRFVLSAPFDFLATQRSAGDGLAGRAAFFVLDPLTLGEVHHSPPPTLLEQALDGVWPEEQTLPQAPPDPAAVLLRGLLPPLLSLNGAQSWVRWWESYLSTYLERDLRQISQIDAVLDYRRLMETLALRTGQPLNQSELARQASLSQPTAHRYLNLLESSLLFDRLPAYPASSSERLVKAPRGFWCDPALAVFLSGYYKEKQLRQAREFGEFFAALIYHHLRTLTRLMTPAGRIYAWRKQAGDEVRFVVEHGRRLLALDLCAANRPGYGDAAGLRKFLEANPQAAGGLLLHHGSEVRRLDLKIVAVPWSLLTG